MINKEVPVSQSTGKKRGITGALVGLEPGEVFSYMGGDRRNTPTSYVTDAENRPLVTKPDLRGLHEYYEATKVHLLKLFHH